MRSRGSPVRHLTGMRRVVLVGAAVALAVAVAAGVLLGRGLESEVSGQAPGESESEVAGRTIEGDELSLADFRGTPVLVNVWASW